jgi:hypothetical protein
MHPVVSRLFLLLLLACDWAADPFHGTSSLSHPLSSTETFCHSLVHRAVLARECAPCPCPCPCPFASPFHFILSSSPALPHEGPPPAASSTDLVYLFMSIQR